MELLRDILQSKKEWVKKTKNPVLTVVNYYYSLRGYDRFDKSFWKKQKDPKFNYARNARDAKMLLKTVNNDLYKCIQMLYNEYSRAKSIGYDWRISTVVKRLKDVLPTKTE